MLEFAIVVVRELSAAARSEVRRKTDALIGPEADQDGSFSSVFSHLIMVGCGEGIGRGLGGDGLARNSGNVRGNGAI